MSGLAAMLPGGRLHLQEGPIDLVIGAEARMAGRMAGRMAPRMALRMALRMADRMAGERPGAEEIVLEAYRLATARFDGLLAELVAELPALRSAEAADLRGPVARAMAAAVARFRPEFVTPMAAVAGAVADAVLAAMIVPGLATAYVNDGGDIALWMAEGESLTAAVAARPGAADRVVVRSGDAVRGIATSGWRGRSQSLGIADAVTVLARTAAEADAAATMIANRVDLPGHPAVRRVPAVEVKADSDLGERLVTVGVGALSACEVDAALARGEAYASALLGRGMIAGAALFLAGEVRVVGHAALREMAGGELV